MIAPTDKKSAAVEQTMRDFQLFFSFNGGTVLEIASEGNAAAERLLGIGARSVVCSNLIGQAGVATSDTISYIRVDATEAGLRSESVDAIFGRAALEHISSMSRLRDEIVRILKPGGVFYLDGAPMWCSPSGHHLWLTAPSGRLYTFSDEDCPVHDWEHLLLSEQEMASALRQRRVDERDVLPIAGYIYHAEGQNRLPTSAVCEVFLGHENLDVAIIRQDIRRAPPGELTARYADHDLTTWRLVIAGRKKVSATEPGILSNLMRAAGETANELQRTRDSYECSISWRITAPLRSLTRLRPRRGRDLR